MIRGRLIDTQGQPAAGAMVRPIMVAGLGTTLETLTTIDPPPYANPLISAVTTDDRGRFLIRGFGKDKAWLEITHERFATQRMHAQPSPSGDSKETPFSLVGAGPSRGGSPTARAASPRPGPASSPSRGTIMLCRPVTDNDGRYSLNPFPGDSFSLTVFPPAGQPYVPWKQGLSFSQSGAAGDRHRPRARSHRSRPGR